MSIFDNITGILDKGFGAAVKFNSIKAQSRAAEIANKERLAKLRFQDVAAQKDLLRAQSNFLTREGLIRLGTQALKVAGVIGTLGTAAWAIRLFIKGRKA